MESATLVTYKSGYKIKKILKLHEQDNYILITIQPLSKPIKKAIQDPLPQFKPIFYIIYKSSISSIVI